MEQNTNSGALGKVAGVLVPIIIVIGGIVALYYLYQYLFGPVTQRCVNALPGTRTAHVSESKPIEINSHDLPRIYEGGEFTVSSWIYINNWSYRSGFNKHILSIGGPNFDTIRMYLGGQKPSLQVRLQTREPTSIHKTTDKPSESLDKLTLNSVFGTLQTHSGLLDSSPLCDLPEIDLQRWVHIAVAVNSRTVDVYLDGKLARSCVLPSFYRVDPGGYSATLLAYGGFGGHIATTTICDSALNPEQVYKNYMSGPEPITSFGGWISSFFAPSSSLDDKTR
jgi:hypothetical protein